MDAIDDNSLLALMTLFSDNYLNGILLKVERLLIVLSPVDKSRPRSTRPPQYLISCGGGTQSLAQISYCRSHTENRLALLTFSTSITQLVHQTVLLNRYRLKTARINKLNTIVNFNRIHNPHALPLGRGETMTGHLVAENTRSYVARVRLMGDVITSSKSKLRLQIAFFHVIVFKL